jgi:hypothetical protein
MSRDHNGGVEFERQLQALLEESVQRVGGRARSRLNQARHAALAQAARRRRWHLPLWPAAWSRSWMPATGVIAAAVLVGFVLWPHPRPAAFPAVEASRASVSDLDLLADHEGMELMQGGDGQFYEWAMAQAESDPSARPAGAEAQGQDHPPPDPDPVTDQNSG